MFLQTVLSFGTGVFVGRNQSSPTVHDNVFLLQSTTGLECSSIEYLLSGTNKYFVFTPFHMVHAIRLFDRSLHFVGCLYVYPTKKYDPPPLFMEHGSMNGYKDFFEKRLKSLDCCDPIECWNTSVLCCYLYPSCFGNTIELAQKFWLNLGCF